MGWRIRGYLLSAESLSAGLLSSCPQRCRVLVTGPSATGVVLRRVEIAQAEPDVVHDVRALRVGGGVQKTGTVQVTFGGPVGLALFSVALGFGVEGEGCEQ